MEGLFDSGASENFINTNVALANGLKLSGILSKVLMASTQITASVQGNISANLERKGRTYPGLSVGVVDSLCTDVILGQAFMKKHNEVIFRLGGPEKRLIVDSPAQCAVTVSKLGTYRLFRNLKSGCKPIATKSRRYNESDKLFIRDEVNKLLNEGVIELLFLPWLALVLVTKDERHKRHIHLARHIHC